MPSVSKCEVFLARILGEDAENSMQPVGAIYTVGVRTAITKLIEEVNFYEVITMPAKEKL